MAGGGLNPQFAPIFVAAGQQYHIPPAILAGVADVETNGGANISTSPTGAQGLMQFEPATAASLGVHAGDPHSAIFGAARLLNQYGFQSNPTRAIGAYNGGPGNPQYGYAAQVQANAARLGPALARYLKGGGGGVGSAPAAIHQPVSGGSPASTTTTTSGGGTDVNSAIADALLSSSAHPITGKVGSGGDILSKAVANIGSGAYTTPVTKNTTTTLGSPAVRAAAQASAGVGQQVPAGSAKGLLQRSGLTLGRTDQGVDFVNGPGKAIPAVIQGRVVHVDQRGSGNGWPGGAMVVIHGTGPDAGRIVYLAENYNPTVKVGQMVTKGQTVGTAVGSYPYTEYGWAANDSGQTLSQAHSTQNTHPSHSNTPEGINFLHYLGY